MSGRAVFLDRDGVLNRLIFNPETQAYESPHRLEDLQLNEGIPKLRRLQEAGYLLFLITNQPSYAKGKLGLETLKAIHAAVDDGLRGAGLRFQEYYYCFHHPEAVLEALRQNCPCRKPSPYFLRRAIRNYTLDAAASWLVGDQDSDMDCARAVGLKTILLETAESASRRQKGEAENKLPDLSSAIERILA